MRLSARGCSVALGSARQRTRGRRAARAGPPGELRRLRTEGEDGVRPRGIRMRWSRSARCSRRRTASPTPRRRRQPGGRHADCAGGRRPCAVRRARGVPDACRSVRGADDPRVDARRRAPRARARARRRRCRPSLARGLDGLLGLYEPWKPARAVDARWLMISPARSASLHAHALRRRDGGRRSRPADDARRLLRRAALRHAARAA